MQRVWGDGRGRPGWDSSGSGVVDSDAWLKDKKEDGVFSVLASFFFRRDAKYEVRKADPGQGIGSRSLAGFTPQCFAPVR